MDLRGFDAEQQESMEFEALPAGQYLAAITATEMKDNANGSGRHLVVEFAVSDGECKGRKLWDRLNLEHSNETAVKFARSRLASICKAVGVLRPNDSTELHGIPMLVTVAVGKNPKNNSDTNEIKSYAAAAKQEAPAPAKTAQTATPRTGPAPWAKK